MQLESIVNEHYDELNENDIHIWNYIIKHKETCRHMSIQQLADECNVSHTTIYRFVKKLELESYSEFKLYLKRSVEKKNKIDSQEISKVYQDVVKTMELIMKMDFYEIYEMIQNAGKIYAFGKEVVQKLAVKDLKRVLITLGYIVNDIEGKSETKIILNQVKKDDVVFLYAFSGNDCFVNEFAKNLKDKGAKVISITIRGTNDLSYIADVALQFYSHPIAYKEGKTDLHMVNSYYIINELMSLKLMELER